MKSILQGVGFTVALVGLALLAAPGTARGDGAEAGGYLGAAFPVGHYTDTADIGSVVGAQGGYRWNMSENGAISLIGGPQFTLLPTENCPSPPLAVSCDNSDDIASTWSFTAGPKFTITGEKAELSVAVLGGFFDDISGPLDEDGGGLAVHGVLGANIGHGMNLGVFVRFEEQFLRATAAAGSGGDDDRQLVMSGFTLNWNFEPEPVEAAPPPPPPPPPAPVTKRKLILRGVNFDFDKSNIRPDARPILDEAIRVLKAEPDIRVRIEGHTDSIGTEQYNLRLSQRRADAVRQYLINGGIAASRLEAVGKGESNPVASNDTADGRAQNRRAELIVL
jgi:outer membrane protein OmpA-like peptidoglycan-associated protein